MINFAVGPVPAEKEVLAIGGNDVPYFRTPNFSEIMKQNESMILELAHAPEQSRAVFCTSSGTGAMEAVVMGTLDPEKDRALVVDGGSFGHRFRMLLEHHGIKHDAIELEYGTALTSEDLKPFASSGYTAFLVNLGETSQGVLYDAELIAEFCKQEGLYLIVDGISSFLADPFDMERMGADILITDAQKALACPPGIAPILMSSAAIDRASSIEQPCMYFDLKDMLRNQDRGQTPFTPAVGILLQIHKRLSMLIESGGADAEVLRCAGIARDFRFKLEAAGLPLSIRYESPSNAVTFVETQGVSAKMICDKLRDEYGIWVCPNGGPAAETSFRVGHLGNHTSAENTLLVAAMKDVLV